MSRVRKGWRKTSRGWTKVRSSRRNPKTRRRAATDFDVERIHVAVQSLKMARNDLREAGAHHAAEYVARAIKSAEGAQRHAFGVAGRSRSRS